MSWRIEGIILFNLAKGGKREALEQIKGLEGVKKVFEVYGEYMVLSSSK